MTPQAMIYWAGMITAFFGGIAFGGIGLGVLVFGISAMVWALFGREA